MVLQFVGFMAGWNNPENLDQTFSAVLCAILTTFATFLPCFFFIFAFAPVIEKPPKPAPVAPKPQKTVSLAPRTNKWKVKKSLKKKTMNRRKMIDNAVTGVQKKVEKTNINKNSKRMYTKNLRNVRTVVILLLIEENKGGNMTSDTSQ